MILLININIDIHKVRNNIIELCQEKPSKIMKECKKIDLPDQHDIREKDLNLALSLVIAERISLSITAYLFASNGITK